MYKRSLVGDGSEEPRQEKAVDVQEWCVFWRKEEKNAGRKKVARMSALVSMFSILS